MVVWRSFWFDGIRFDGPSWHFLFVVTAKEGATNYPLLAEASVEIWWGKITHHICPHFWGKKKKKNVPKTVILQHKGCLKLQKSLKKTWICAFVKECVHTCACVCTVLFPSQLSVTCHWSHGACFIALVDYGKRGNIPLVLGADQAVCSCPIFRVQLNWMIKLFKPWPWANYLWVGEEVSLWSSRRDWHASCMKSDLKVAV